MKAFHDNPMGGHLGHEKTYDKIRARYYRAGMYKDIQHWVISCVENPSENPSKSKESAFITYSRRRSF